MLKYRIKDFVLLLLIVVLLSPTFSYARRAKDSAFEALISNLGRESEIRKRHPEFFDLRYRGKVIANIRYLENELDVPLEEIATILTLCRSRFFVNSLEINRAKVDFLVSELEIAPDEIGEFLVDLALPKENTLTSTDPYRHTYDSVMLLDFSVENLGSKIDVIRSLHISDSYDLMQELKPIMNLNTDLCAIIAEYLYDSLEGLEGCGKRIAMAYGYINSVIKRDYGRSVYEAFVDGSTDIIASVLERYRL